MNCTWILVAHGSAAKLIAAKKNGQEISRIRDFSHPETALKDQDIHSDRPGRSFNSASPARHAMDYQEDPVDHERRVFAKEMADFLATAHAQNQFNKLIIVSSPSLLGFLRKTLCDSLKRAITHELNADLMSLNLKDDELIQKIRDDLDLVVI